MSRKGSVATLSSADGQSIFGRMAELATGLWRAPWLRYPLLLTALFLICQALPQRDGQSQTVPQIVQDMAGPVLRFAPSWLGLWSVQTPRGLFHEHVPAAETIEAEAEKVLPLIDELRASKFFRIFKVDLDKDCPFWARDDLCKSPTGACSVCECAEEEIPALWKQNSEEFYVDRHFYDAEEISPWSEPSRLLDSAFLPVLDGTDAGGKSTYVDLSLNPPGFTAYRGRNIWELIYKENCLREPGDKATGECSEANTFEHVISGLQTAIMTLAAEFNAPSPFGRLPVPLSAPSKYMMNLDGRERATTRHKYNLDLFRWRVAPHRKWMENLYFDFSLLLRTVVKVAGVIENCPCNTGDEKADESARQTLQALLATARQLPSADAKRLAVPLFEQKQQLALERFTNISRIFDCVECEKCRLHGKVKLAALQVALKANGRDRTSVLRVERNELTALVNALGYFGDSIMIIKAFERRVLAMRRITMTAVVLLVSTLLLRVAAVQKLGSQTWAYVSHLVQEFVLRRTAGTQGTAGLSGASTDPISLVNDLMMTETTSGGPVSSGSSGRRRGDEASSASPSRRRRGRL